MNTDPWYAAYHYSHPFLAERLAGIEAEALKVEKKAQWQRCSTTLWQTNRQNWSETSFSMQETKLSFQMKAELSYSP